MCKPVFILFCLITTASTVSLGQEMQARVTVIAGRVPTTIDHKIFQTLQTALTNFVNNRKWTNETFQTSEKIVCNLTLNVNSAGDNNTFKASLTVQAARPIFNSTYQSPLINFIDDNVAFRYIEFQPLDFNESRVQGTEPFAANLTAVFAYYVNIILGLTFDSYSLRGGDPYFQKALNIVNNSPDSRDILGWKAFDGVRNRYWLTENLTNSKYTLFHDVFYNYYRQGLDQMYDKQQDARFAILTCLNRLNAINVETPNTMAMQFFFQGKSTEIAKIFKAGTPDEKTRALELLSRLDVGNSNRYKQELQ
jgi:hypothetical protein